MNQTPSPETVIRRAVAKALAQVRVCLPGIVQAYDPERCEATVQIALLEPRVGEDGVRGATRMPAVSGVPVWFQGGGNGRLTFPIAAGDECVLIFCSSSIERWLEVGGEVDPSDGRHHDLSDAVALVGGRSFANAKAAHATATVLEGDDVRLSSKDAADPIVRRSDLDAVVLQLKGHTHTVATTGTAAAQTGVAAPNAAAFSTPACSPDVKAP